MQTNTSAQNLIYTGHYPFSNFGSQTDRRLPKPNPNRELKPINGPNDTTSYHCMISLRTLTRYTGSEDDNYYLITLPVVIDRPKTIQITGTTIGHINHGTGAQTVMI